MSHPAPFPNILDSFKLKSHADNDLLLQFFRERQMVELKYAEDLNSLVSKFKPLCNLRPNVDKLLDFTAALVKDHSQVAKFLSSTVKMLDRHIQNERTAIGALQTSLTGSVGPGRVELLGLVEKSKEAYLKKHSDLGASLKSYEATQDLQELTQAYRDDIVDLERNRNIIVEGRDFARRTFEKYEAESFSIVQGCYRAFSKSIETMANNKLKASQAFNPIIATLKAHKFDEVHFNNFWPIPQNVYFEHFESGSPLKDLVFGVPLTFTFRNTPTIIPTFLKLSIEQIEARGLSIEGIYRVSAKNSDRDKARIEIETDVFAFNYEGADVHILTGLVKAYLRELPEPLCPFNTNERAAYNFTVDIGSRLERLRKWLTTLPRSSLIVLKFLVEHLARVDKKSEKNKMSIDNLSLIFSALLFDRQGGTSASMRKSYNALNVSPTSEKDSSSKWGFPKLKSSAAKSERHLDKDPPKDKHLSITSNLDKHKSTHLSGTLTTLTFNNTESVAEALKNELVLQDLVHNMATIFNDPLIEQDSPLSDTSQISPTSTTTSIISPPSTTVPSPNALSSELSKRFDSVDLKVELNFPPEDLAKASSMDELSEIARNSNAQPIRRPGSPGLGPSGPVKAAELKKQKSATSGLNHEIK